MRRFLVLASLLTAPGVAAAENVLDGYPIEFEIRVTDPESGDDHRVIPNQSDYELERRFNYARCVCGQIDAIDDPDTSFLAHLTYGTQPPGAVDEAVEIWQGVDCNSSEMTIRTANCGPAPKATIADADEIKQSVDVRLRVYDQIRPNGGGCDASGTDEFESDIWAVTDPDNNGVFDDVFQLSTTPDFDLIVDTQLPPVPGKFAGAAGGEEALDVRWENPSTGMEDILKWQLLCATADGEPAFADPRYPKAWESPTDFCSGEGVEGVPITPIEIGEETDETAFYGPIPDAGRPDAAIPPDAGPGGPDLSFLPVELQNLDPAYVCGEAAGSASRIRVEGLENGTPYYFVLLAVDKAGNARGVTFAEALTPQPVTDFWEQIHEDGSDVEGGFCLIADAYGESGPGGAITSAMRDFRDRTLASSAAGRTLIDLYYEHAAGGGSVARGSAVARVAIAIALLPAVVLALLWHYLTLPGLVLLVLAVRLFPRARRAVAVAIALLVPSLASAQAFEPYWDDETEIDEVEGPDAIRWHVGLKAGPYIPAIDEQLGFGEGNGPYHRIFGGYNILPVLEVDYVIWHPPGGQLTIGGTGGVLGKTGNAIAMDGSPSEGNETSFRLLPLAATSSYRLTMLDDEYGVPVIPYLKGGLAYYVWWITKPSGAIAVVDMDNKARGASLGIQASAGLAVRAERIDPAAAASMRDSGLFHAGFYAEYQIAWVDGFGSDKKLAVGDSTWFVGVDFEF